MKKQNIFPIIGITSASILILASLVTLTLFLLKISIKDWMVPYNFLSPFFVFLIFLSFKDIIVSKSNLDNFKNVIYLSLVTQISLFFIIWTLYFKILPPKPFAIPFIITAISMAGLFIWFVILIFKTDKKEIKAFSFLQYFAITTCLLIITRVIGILTMGKNSSLDQTSSLLGGIPYIFLIFFFSGHIDKSHDSLSNVPYA